MRGLSHSFMSRPSSSRNVLMWDIGAAHTLYPALQTCGVTERVACGFTLIELLVVVIIIGIFAAVALPQYQKAVEKSRATEAVLTISTLEKSIDRWLLENGTPMSGGGASFFITDGSEPSHQDLDIDFPCDKDRYGLLCNHYSYGASCDYMGKPT